jgi:hypothetical protein
VRASGFFLIGIGAAFIVGSASTELAASVRPDDIFELFVGGDEANSAEDHGRTRVKTKRQSRASIFDLFDDERVRDERNREISIKPEQKKLRSSSLATPPQKSAPVPRTKPGARTSTPSAHKPLEESTGKVTCQQAREIISKYAFSEVNRNSCSGSVYQFKAMRNGKPFLIKISARNGELLEVKKDDGASAANEPPSQPQANNHLVPKSELRRR